MGASFLFNNYFVTLRPFTVYFHKGGKEDPFTILLSRRKFAPKLPQHPVKSAQVADVAEMAPVRREKGGVVPGGEAVVDQKHDAAVVLSADDASRCLENLVHAGENVCEFISALADALVVVAEQIRLG